MSWAAMVDDPAREREALALVDEVVKEAAADGDVVNHAWASVVAVNRRLLLGEVAAAGRDADVVLDLAERGALPYFVAAGHRGKAMALAAGGGWHESVPHWRAALEHTVAVADTEGLTLTLRLAAAAAAHCELDDLAGQLWSVAPAGHGNSVMVSPFAQAEERLRHTVRPLPPTGLHDVHDVHDAFRRSMVLLDYPADDDRGAGASASTPAGRGRTLRFETCQLDIGCHELRRGGAVVNVEPQVFDVLVALARRGGRLVTKHDLLDEVWGDRFVSDSTLTSRVRAARRAVGDDGRQQRVIRTVHGRGYRFVATVTET